MSKWVKVGTIVVLAFGVCYVAFFLGHLNGRGAAHKFRARQSLDAIYGMAKGEITYAPVEMQLCRVENIAELQEAERKYGKVLSYRIDSMYVTPIGLPVTTNVVVKRTKAATQEFWVVHSPRGFSDLSIEQIKP